MIRRLRIPYIFLSTALLLAGVVLQAQPAIKVACIGNSVTYGYGHKTPQQTAYPAMLQRLLGEEYTVRNFGHSGATLLRKGHNPYFKTKVFEEALQFAPDIAVIHLGLNDTDPRNWPQYGDEFAADYAWLIDTIRKINAAVKIFIARLSPIFPDHKRFLSGTRDWFWQIQALMPQIATANNTGLVDFHTPLYSRPDLFPDAVHPNEAGAAIIAKAVHQKITGDYGGLQLPAVFASHMVLQRGKPVSFYGKANRGEMIDVAFGGVTKKVVAGDDGEWKTVFPAMKEGGPFKAIIKSPTKTILLDDILIGEVWLCAGQSNMAFPLRSAVNASGEMMEAQANKNLRLLQMEPFAETNNTAWDTATLARVNELQYFSGSWQRCDSTAAKNFSAVAYYFAKRLQQNLSLPIGLVQVAVGGSTTESWIDRYTMEHHPVLVAEWNDWRKSDFFQPWVRQRADTNLFKSNNPKQRHPYGPAYNFEAGISHLTSFPIRGVIWYQGESNAHNIELHQVLFPALVKSWRRWWGYDFPFYYVQLSSLNRPSWPAFRNSQLQMLQQLPNTGMAVSSDVGDSSDVHPRKKREVGERLAYLALHFTYGKKDVVPYGPMPLKAVHSSSHILLHFAYAGRQLKTAGGKPLKGFSLVDDKGRMTERAGVIEKDKVLVPVKKDEKFVAVRYGWQPFTDANLTNEAGLPASTFKLDIEY